MLLCCVSKCTESERIKPQNFAYRVEQRTHTRTPTVLSTEAATASSATTTAAKQNRTNRQTARSRREGGWGMTVGFWCVCDVICGKNDIQSSRYYCWRWLDWQRHILRRMSAKRVCTVNKGARVKYTKIIRIIDIYHHSHRNVYVETITLRGSHRATYAKRSQNFTHGKKPKIYTESAHPFFVVWARTLYIWASGCFSSLRYWQ